MKPWMERHVLALARRIAEQTQAEVAARVGCSLETIKSIETQRVPLTRKTARALSIAIYADVEWLLMNDHSAPPISCIGSLYTKEVFDRLRAAEDKVVDDDFMAYAPFFVLKNYVELRAILASASRAGMATFLRASNLLSDAVRELRDEFGSVPEISAKDRIEAAPFEFNEALASLVEHDLQASRERFGNRNVKPSPRPTKDSMAKYHAFRRRYETKR